MTRHEVDQIGNRLRQTVTVKELKSLDAYRRKYRNSYDSIVGAIREKLDLIASGRPAKSTTAIVEKLKRGTMRLSQMQDIAGCRIVVRSYIEQDRVVESLTTLFPSTTYDRRKIPSNGYRAVHVIASHNSYPVEVQVRTALQHLWAELSEKFADVYDPSIKYGGGSETVRKLLDGYSSVIAKLEMLEIADPNGSKIIALKEDIQSALQNAISTFRSET